MSENASNSDEEHPVFRALVEYASLKPDATLDHPWGDTVFKVGGKIFVYLGRNACTVKPLPEELDLLLGAPMSRYQSTSAATAGSPSASRMTRRWSSRSR
jgi:YjbR